MKIFTTYMVLIAQLATVINPIKVIADDVKHDQCTTVTVDSLNIRGAVIGMLGEPLGKVVTIDGEIIDGRTLRNKSYDGVKLLQVSEVNGQKLDKSRCIQFIWFTTANSKKIKGRVKLIGYETGEYTGVPHEAFKYVDLVAAEGFQFVSTFIILKSLSLQGKSTPEIPIPTETPPNSSSEKALN
ncbi:MAG: hypothetical protein SFY80_02940 [Verrucomicrobiota bacterium]|nr:hypothetical protein [Verrucomicrobiota bacterium]